VPFFSGAAHDQPEIKKNGPGSCRRAAPRWVLHISRILFRRGSNESRADLRLESNLSCYLWRLENATTGLTRTMCFFFAARIIRGLGDLKIKKITTE
jgi:hypothetical protein